MNRFLLLALSMFLCTLSVQSQVYNIVDFGAVSDNNTENSASIQSAIDSCNVNGGGTVYVPSGIFVTGTIELKSNVSLFLESGAELKGSPNVTDYKAHHVEGYDTSYYGVVFAHKADNVSILGTGAINGNEEVFFEWDKAKTIEWGGCQYTRQKDHFREVEIGIGDGPVTPKLRPRQMVIFSECKNVLLRDVSIVKSPFWALHFADCDGVIVSGLKVHASMDTPNSDGIDITSCRNVAVSDCDIRTGDDAIAITGYAYHFELPGYNNLIHESDNITITNCNLQSRSSGIRIGFIDQNSVRNIHISNINITNSNRGIGIFTRGDGAIENVTISQVYIETRLHTGDWWGNGEPIHISSVPGTSKKKVGHIKNVTFRDVTCVSENGILIYGSKGNEIQDLRFENLRFNLVAGKLNSVAGGNIDLRGAAAEKSLFASDIPAFYVQYVEDLQMRDVQINWGHVKENYFTHGLQISNFSGLRLSNVKAKASPSNSKLSGILLENGTGLFSDDMTRKSIEIKNVK